MPAERQLHLNLNLLNAGTFAAAWRWPDSRPTDFIDTGFFVRTARLAERGTFDAVFLADFPALAEPPHSRPFLALEPTVALTAMAAATEHIGLIGTVSSTYNEPYNIARRFASLDHVSAGRTGINIVTTADLTAAKAFGRSERPAHATRYERAAEFAWVLKALWDSWEDEALVGDATTGRFADLARIHPVAFEGRHLSVSGALNVPRPPQGHPVVVQAGGSPEGIELAARHAEAVFSMAHTLEEAGAYAETLRARLAAHGRPADAVRIFPGLVTVIGSTEAEARRREEALWNLLPLEYGLRRLAGVLGVDPGQLDLDAPLPPDLKMPEDGIQTFFKGAVERATREKLTVRQLIRAQGGGTSHRTVIGTPEQVAASIEEWFRSGLADGFNIMPDVIASGLEAFVDHVVPLLRRRGLFRHAYSGKTLRNHLGLERPARAFAAVPAQAGAVAAG